MSGGVSYPKDTKFRFHSISGTRTDQNAVCLSLVFGIANWECAVSSVGPGALGYLSCNEQRPAAHQVTHRITGANPMSSVSWELVITYVGAWTLRGSTLIKPHMAIDFELSDDPTLYMQLISIEHGVQMVVLSTSFPYVIALGWPSLIPLRSWLMVSTTREGRPRRGHNFRVNAILRIPTEP